MVETVLHVSQVTCRRKRKLVKVWHTPKPGPEHTIEPVMFIKLQFLFSEPLLTSELSYLIDQVQVLIENFDSGHSLYDNKEYADLLWKVATTLSSKHYH